LIGEAAMLALILFLILIYVAAGIVGFVIKGLLWLFVLACVLFAVTLVVGGVRAGRRSARRI
jgi:membrane protein implicated in regulation of membrane protease activity